MTRPWMVVSSEYIIYRREEAVGAAVITAVSDTDWIVPTHRFHTVQPTWYNFKAFSAEYFGKVPRIAYGISCDLYV